MCSLKGGFTPLMHAAKSSESPAVVEALVNGKANLEATNSVRHLKDYRCSPYVLIDHACVLVVSLLYSADVRCGII